MHPSTDQAHFLRRLILPSSPSPEVNWFRTASKYKIAKYSDESCSVTPLLADYFVRLSRLPLV